MSFRAATLALVLLAAFGIALTWERLSHTPDEPVHIAAGMEWLQRGTYRLHPENPPLARVAVALGPRSAGLRPPAEGPLVQRGLDVLYEGGDYARHLALARMGTLPFFLLAAVVVWRWALALGGPRAGFIAAASFCTLPPVLGHAGLATTDVAFAATFALALRALWLWLERPSRGRSLACGASLGLALATKFSTLVFFPPCALVLVLFRLATRARVEPARPAAWARTALLAAAACGTVVWASYRFSFGAPGAGVSEVAVERGLPGFLADLPLPAPEAVRGVAMLRSHVRAGHSAYLFGRESPDGFAAFYPVALLVKTPLAFQLLALAAVGGLLLALRRREPPGPASLAPAGAAAALLLTAVFSTINIGLRHVLAFYPLAAVSLGVGVDVLLRDSAVRSRRAARLARVGAGLLLAWQALLAAAVHPDYVGWFNPLAGSEPDRILVDSDLDWGQDVLQLERFCSGREIELLQVALFGNERLCEHAGLPPLRWLPPDTPVTGWVAVSEMYFTGHWRRSFEDVCDRRQAVRYEGRGGYRWLREHEPTARIGSSIRLYRLPPE